MRLLLMLSGALLLAACSSSGSEGETSDAAAIWDTSTIVEHLALEVSASDGAHVFLLPAGEECGIPVILTSRGQVELYASAGDIVAVNPEQTAGVKIVANESASCLAAITERLTSLEQ